MQSTKIGALSCCAQNYKQNTSFKAKLSNETISKIGSSPSHNYLELYNDIFQINENLGKMGSKDTKLEIKNPKDLSFDDGGYVSLGSEYSSEYVEDWVYKHGATLQFTHPLFDNINGKKYESVINFEKPERLAENGYLQIAKDIDAKIIEQGEENIAIAYAKDLIASVANKGSLVEASKEFINKLEQSDFNKKAIVTIKNAFKSIDLKNKLDTRINQLLKL